MIPTFEQWLEEELNVPNQDKGLKRRRHTMPQLTDFDRFKSCLKDNDVKLSTKKVKADTLTPTQSNFNEAKVKRMVDEGVWKKGAIVISKDGFVIDGHHRWLAACEAKGEITCHVVDMGAEDLLDYLADKDYIEKKGINENMEHHE